jgi:hypothetical protein
MTAVKKTLEIVRIVNRYSPTRRSCVFERLTVRFVQKQLSLRKQNLSEKSPVSKSAQQRPLK